MKKRRDEACTRTVGSNYEKEMNYFEKIEAMLFLCASIYLFKIAWEKWKKIDDGTTTEGLSWYKFIRMTGAACFLLIISIVQVLSDESLVATILGIK